MERIVNVKFPKINKNFCLKENDLEIRKGFNVEKCIVKRTLKVSREVFDSISSDFMTERDKLLWDKIGGRELVDGEYLTAVVEVVSDREGETFYVNTEGFDYARYVGRLHLF